MYLQNKLWTFFFISFAIAAITCSQIFTLPKIEPKLLQEDFQIARTALEQGHSGIYRYTSKVQLDQVFDDSAKS